MNKVKVIILGSTGFVGKNLVKVLQASSSIQLILTSRNTEHGYLHFDLAAPSSWQNVIAVSPDIIIDASGYGVVKNQTDLDVLYSINYLRKRDFLDCTLPRLTNSFWIQIGTAFEYSLEHEKLHEDSPCFPKSHYGISKSLFSSYLRSVMHERFAILRPFGMFGAHEDVTKFFPLLISAQKNRKKIALSDGQQYRDYFYVEDLARFILQKIEDNQLYQIEGQIVNVGSGIARQLRKLSEMLSAEIPNFDSSLWDWEALPQRSDENSIFFNSSEKANSLGFCPTNLQDAFKKTVDYYYTI